MDTNTISLRDYAFRYDAEIPDDISIIKYKSPHSQFECGVVGAGSILLVKGREKSRKSAFLSAMITGAFVDDPLINLGFDIELADDELIAYFDTEHSLGEFSRIQKRFHDRIGFFGNSSQYVPLTIRDLNYRERLQIVSLFAQKCTAKGKKIKVLCLDQAGDFVSDINNDESVQYFQNWALRLAQEYSCVVAVVVHANRGGQETLGKLGAAMDKKLSSSWLVNYDDETHMSCAYNQKARDLPVYDKICFKHNEEKHIELVLNDVGI